ncbi:MAG: hypothetical protein PHY16_16265 [Methylobacter sp.]|nr:hypothetical protein [Methylobacter sp.]
MNITPKLDLIDQPSNDNSMHLLQLREADASASQSLDPGPEVQVFAFYLLDVALADLTPANFQMPLVSPQSSVK